MELSKNTTPCPLHCYRSAGEVPLAIVIFFLVAFLVGVFGLTGCSPNGTPGSGLTAAARVASGSEARATTDDRSTADESRGVAPAAAGPVATRNLLPIRAVHVQQYEDRLPQETGSALPGLITLVQFEIDVCENDVSDANFSVVPESTGGFARAQVITNRRLEKCASPHAQQFTASTGAFAKGAAIAVANPLLVETLAPSN